MWVDSSLMTLGSAAALIVFAAAGARGQSREPSGGALALVGGTIHVSPSDEPIADGVVLIQEGLIAAVGTSEATEVPATFDVLDCAGLTIAAGFWNSHVHFFERKWKDASSIPADELDRQLEEAFTRYGFTSVFDTGSVWENTRALRDRIESGDVLGPRLRSAGEALMAPNAMPSERILGVLGFTPLPSPEIANEEQALEAARHLLGQGVNAIKLHLQPPPPPHPPFPESAIPLVVREAHRAGRPVFVHPHDGADVLAALRAGVDVIAHTTPLSGPWDETLLTAIRQSEAALTPTLNLWKSVMRHDRVSFQLRTTETAGGQLRAWVGAGGDVLFGTDLGAVDPDPSEEYALMAEAGMSFAQILTSLTTAPAEQFGESTRAGRVARGLRADLVVLDSDPAENLAALSAVRYTLRDGRVIYRSGE